MFDWTINIGHVSSVIVFLVAGTLVYAQLRSDLRALKLNMEFLQKRQESMSEAFSQLGSILTQVAVQDNRLQMMEKSVDELRHGQGFISNRIS